MCVYIHMYMCYPRPLSTELDMIFKPKVLDIFGVSWVWMPRSSFTMAGRVALKTGAVSKDLTFWLQGPS